MPVLPAIAAAASEKVWGYMSSGGVFTSRRARLTPSAITAPVDTASAGAWAQTVWVNRTRFLAVR